MSRASRVSNICFLRKAAKINVFIHDFFKIIRNGEQPRIVKTKNLCSSWEYVLFRVIYGSIAFKDDRKDVPGFGFLNDQSITK